MNLCGINAVGEVIRDILKGVGLGDSETIPQSKATAVKIFLSSTFTDTTVERNELISKVFPKLREYCRSKYSYEFQVVDMRWGVQDSANDDHSTSALCMREIANCQKSSAGTTFVALLGDKYGTRYLPTKIPNSHWEKLISKVTDADMKKQLTDWYREDMNADPPERILQPLSVMNVDSEIWWGGLKDSLYSALKEAAQKAYNEDGLMNEHSGALYKYSVTEEEVQNGILNNLNRNSTCLAFCRTLKNINTGHKDAKRFIDMMNDDVDQELQELLGNLKSKVKTFLSKANVKEYELEWSDDKGISTTEHSAYLDQFCKDFYSLVRAQIDKFASQQSQEQKVIYSDKLASEALFHIQQCKDKCTNTTPSSDIMEVVKNYVCGDNSRKPLVLHGQSGCGKTSIMCHIAAKVAEWWNTENLSVAVRLLGTSPDSSTIEKVLASITQQIEHKRKDHSLEFDTLKGNFIGAISYGLEQDKKIVILLDSLDQLEVNRHAYGLSWLPEHLGENVRIIISTLPDVGEILDNARKLDIPSENFVEVKPLSEVASWNILNAWLSNCGRKLSDNQSNLIESVLAADNVTPLYIKLTFDLIKTWNSHTLVSSLPTDVTTCINDLFDRLETTHGQVQVQRSLGYLTACPGGISQAELEDVLSLDDEFLNEAFQYHMPPNRRIPPSLWVRIRSDISDYLVERDTDNVSVMSWYHRQFKEHAMKRYYDECNIRSALIYGLEDFFSGKFASVEKSFKYSSRQSRIVARKLGKDVQKLTDQDMESQTDRYVSAQPTTFSKFKYNGRKINTLTSLWLIDSVEWDYQKKAAELFYDMDFLIGIISHAEWSDIRKKILSLQNKLAILSGKDNERFYQDICYLTKVLTMYSSFFKLHPRALRSLLLDCLQDKFDMTDYSQPNTISWLLYRLLTDKEHLESSALVPIMRTLQSPGGMKVWTHKPTMRVADKLDSITTYHCDGEDKIVLITQFGNFWIFNKTSSSEYCLEQELTIISSSIYVSIDSHHVADVNETFLIVCSKKEYSVFSTKQSKFILSILQSDLQKNEFCFNHLSVHQIFINPVLTGENSLLYFSWCKDGAQIISGLIKQPVWWFVGPKISFASIADTADSVKKIIYIGITQYRTGAGYLLSYSVALLPNGYVTVEGPNRECYPEKMIDDKMHKFETCSFAVMSKQLPTCHSPLYFDQSSGIRGSLHGSIYLLLWPCDAPTEWSMKAENRKLCDDSLRSNASIRFLGKLRSGEEVLAVMRSCYEIDVAILPEFKATRIPFNPGGFSFQQQLNMFREDGTRIKTKLVEGCDVLIAAFEKRIHVYFLKAVRGLVEVTEVFDINAAKDMHMYMTPDSSGQFLVATASDAELTLFDLTLAQPSDDSLVSADTTDRPTKRFNVNIAPEPLQIALTRTGYFWSTVDLSCLGKLPGERGVVQHAKWFSKVPGEEYTLVTMTGSMMEVFNVTVTMNKVLAEATEEVSELCTTISSWCSTKYGMMICNVSGYIWTYDIRKGGMLPKGKLKSHYNAMCANDEYLFCCNRNVLKEENIHMVCYKYLENYEPADPHMVWEGDATRAHVNTMLYFEVVDKIFLHISTFAPKKATVYYLFDCSSLSTVMSLNVGDVNVKAFQNHSICGNFSNDPDTEFYCCCNGQVYKYNIRDVYHEGFSTGVILGSTKYGKKNALIFSPDKKYVLAFESSEVSIARLADMEVIGIYAVTDSVNRGEFTADSQCVQISTKSGKFISLRIIDPKYCDPEKELAALPFTNTKKSMNTSLVNDDEFKADKTADEPPLYSFIVRYIKDNRLKPLSDDAYLDEPLFRDLTEAEKAQMTPTAEEMFDEMITNKLKSTGCIAASSFSEVLPECADISKQESIPGIMTKTQNEPAKPAETEMLDGIQSVEAEVNSSELQVNTKAKPLLISKACLIQ